MPRKAIVVGGGVIGLTSAIRLLEDGWAVKIVAAEFSPNTLSDGTLAFWEPFLAEPKNKVLQWATDSLEAFKALEGSKGTGVHPVSGYEFSTLPEFPVPEWLHLMKWRHATPEELPPGLASGIFYTTLVAESPLFMNWLMNRVKTLGGTFQRRKLFTLSQLLTDPFHPSIIVNCSGLGARDLEEDLLVEPIRGQVVRVDFPAVRQFYCSLENGEYAYVLPRSDLVVCGGSATRGDWRTETDYEETKAILQRCEKLVPGISQRPIIRIFAMRSTKSSTWVGLRPGRTSIRLEAQPLKGGGKDVLLLHNYGHGGCGVTLSWGCAKEIQQLARAHVLNGVPLKSKL